MAGAAKTAGGSAGCCGGKCGCLKTVSDAITKFLETCFDKLGTSIGRYPVRYILGSLFVCALCGIGLVRFTEVTDPDKLWVPSDAEILKEKDWIEANFPSTTRVGFLLGVSSNILTPQGLGALLDLYQDVTTRNSSGGSSIADVCIKAGPNCIVRSILELWSYNDATIRALSQTDIINDVNNITTSPMYSGSIDLATLLGERTTNSTGDVTAASAALMTFLLQGGDSIKDTTNDWEGVLIDVGKGGHADLSSTFVFAFRSFSEEAGAAISGDVIYLSIGYMIVIIFVMIVLSRCNLMEQRIGLTVAGILAVGLSILVSFGLASAVGFEYGPLQSVLPFLLLGIGVDDMFVIMGALANLEPEEQEYDIPRKMGDVLRHAGVSITVTSITDFVAFGIGATTVLPSLRSFCVYAAFGILGLFFLQAIFFSACLTLDLRRLAARRDGCLCCYRHKDTYTPNSCSKKELIPMFFKRVMEPLLSKLPVKVFVMVVTLGLFGMNVWGFVNLEQYFDPNWFFPTDSYASEFLVAQSKYFPDDGVDGNIYCGNIDYFGSKTGFDTVYTKFTDSQYIYNGTTDSWFKSLTDWLAVTTDADALAMIDASKYPTSEANFVNLTYRVINEQQTRLSQNLLFDSTYADITASKIPYQHTVMSTTSEQIEALDATRQMIRDAGFSESECFPYSPEYLTWETNRVIQEELYRNLGLACLCVFLVTLILIAHVGTSLMVFSCVVFTLVDVAGTMHLWGLTIDTVTTIILILAIGLAVDYSAHIGHMFMTVTGTRSERVKETLGEMGPPVFYGGFSTFLAFILLVNSNSYVFTTFFKVFLLVVIYGLFHGLFFLPVLLSWLGPDPYSTADRHFHPAHESRPSTSHDAYLHGVDNPAMTKEPKLPPISNGVAPTANGITQNGYSTGMNGNAKVRPLPAPSANGSAANPRAPMANGYANANPPASRQGSRTPPPDYSPPDSPATYHNPRGLPRVQM